MKKVEWRKFEFPFSLRWWELFKIVLLRKTLTLSFWYQAEGWMEEPQIKVK